MKSFLLAAVFLCSSVSLRAADASPDIKALKEKYAKKGAQMPAADPSAPWFALAKLGIVLDGRDPSPAVMAALKAAMARVSPLPSGVELVVTSYPKWGDNPLIEIAVDGHRVYTEYLYHSEANLAKMRRSWLRPGTWAIPSDASPDLSKRFEAALTMAHEGAPSWRALLLRSRPPLRP